MSVVFAVTIMIATPPALAALWAAAGYVASHVAFLLAR